MEAGWIVTEVGRQPWVVYKLMTTAQAATTNQGVIASLSARDRALTPCSGSATILILRLLARHWRAGEEQDSAVPYGPPSTHATALGGRQRDQRSRRSDPDHRPGDLAIFAGADFGGGLWDATRRRRSSRPPRTAADRRDDHTRMGANTSG